MAENAFSPSTLEVETSGPSGVRDQSGLNSKLEAIQGYTVSYNKDNKIETKAVVSTHRTRHIVVKMAVEFHSGARQHTQKMKTAQTPRSLKQNIG